MNRGTSPLLLIHTAYIYLCRSLQTGKSDPFQRHKNKPRKKKTGDYDETRVKSDLFCA